MASKSSQHYQVLMLKANEYHRKALWQEKLRIWRRLGQYGRAEKMLQQSLDAFKGASSSFRASVLGELGVMARHNREYLKAQEAFREQGRLAREAPSSLESDAEIYRAIGNEGMSAFNLWQQGDPKDQELLNTAIKQFQERISRAQKLQRRLSSEAPTSKYAAMAHAWEIIRMDRLTLCHIAAGTPGEAVRVAEESQRRQTREDPTVTAFSRFFYGNALWHDGQREQAVEQWNGPPGTCTSPMAFCKEPGAEYNDYLKLMAGAGVNFDSYDEQGFSALEHAVLSDSLNAWEAIPIVQSALRDGFSRDIGRDNPHAVRVARLHPLVPILRPQHRGVVVVTPL
ncbi:hypothetical protein CSOJ01_12818 [Colletotrichum sojae]|uniref:Uncharacterized protein n=1 Tax=Colletotrichum sojae TaxID=2175907 RepID=A0A8H6MLW8_9PEZI|nr:hypothetical protein CSOJ01_12818 [Colletotrichum sojae]